MSQDHFVLFNILDLGIFRYTFFIVRIILFNCLNYIDLTLGKNGGLIFLFSNFYQSIFLKNGWNLTYSIPLEPNLFSGFLWINLLTKSTLYRLHPNAGISSNWTCLASIFYRIYLRFSPIYGRYINIFLLFLWWIRIQ
jgi:hypothetical protein